jgi:hypothetical protein
MKSVLKDKLQWKAYENGGQREMKTINWEKCKTPGVWHKNVNKKDRSPLPTDPITPNMKVIANYKGCSIFLKIITEIGPNKFKALVTNIRPAGPKKPDDLLLNDEVCIDREFICTICLD